MIISHPDFLRPILRLGVALSMLVLLAACGTAPGKPGRSSSGDAIYLVERSRIEPGVQADFDRALALLKAERYAEAIELLTKVTKSAQNLSAPYVNLAKAYVLIGDYEQAEVQLDHAMRINPDHPATLQERALLYRATGRYGEARRDYERLVGLYPDFLPARKNFGILCELYLDDARCALEQYRIYMKQYPDDEEVMRWVQGLERKVGG